jgi:hypothetical protein
MSPKHPKYNYLFMIGYSLESDEPADALTREQHVSAILRRAVDINEDVDGWREAMGEPIEDGVGKVSAAEPAEPHEVEVGTHRGFYLVRARGADGEARIHVYSTKLPDDCGYAGCYATRPDEASAKAFIDGMLKTNLLPTAEEQQATRTEVERKQTALKREINDEDAMMQIHRILDTSPEWDSSTTSAIHDVVLRTGRYVRDEHEHDEE